MAFQSGSMLAQDSFTMDRFNELKNDAMGMPGTPIYTLSRGLGTAYQNTSGAATMEIITLHSGGTAGTVVVEVSSNGTTFGTVGRIECSTGTLTSLFSVPLPNTWYLKVSKFGANQYNLDFWTKYSML